jgi:uncharacterized protein (TIGR02996 family)
VPANLEEAFLQAVIESPDDDTPRLVYSDWLEENGDPKRAEFIRVQCELARLTEPGERSQQLRWREQALLQRYGPAWASPFRKRVQGWEFRRGFVEKVTTTVPMFVTRARNLSCLAPVRAVTFRNARGQLGRLAGLVAGMKRVREIDFVPDDGFRDEDVRLLTASPHLGGLKNLSMAGSFGVAALRALTEGPSPFLLVGWRCNPFRVPLHGGARGGGKARLGAGTTQWNNARTRSSSQPYNESRCNMVRQRLRRVCAFSGDSGARDARQSAKAAASVRNRRAKKVSSTPSVRTSHPTCSRRASSVSSWKKSCTVASVMDISPPVTPAP